MEEYKDLVMREIHNGRHSAKFADLMKLVDNGGAYIKGGLGLYNDTLINITTKKDNITYYYKFPFGWKEFNERFGKEYLDNWNLYFM